MYAYGLKIHQFKAKVSEIKLYSFFLGNILKDFTIHNMKKKTGLNGKVYNISVSYDTIDISDIANMLIL